MSFLRNIPIVRNFLGDNQEERPAAPPARSSPLAAASPFVGVGFGSPAAAGLPKPTPTNGLAAASGDDRAGGAAGRSSWLSPRKFLTIGMLRRKLMAVVARAGAVARALGLRAHGLLRVLSTEGFPGEPLRASQGSPQACRLLPSSAVMWARFRLTSRPQWALAMAFKAAGRPR